jgi:hypothetical protein
MNWIEIDKILYRIINKHDTIEDVYKEAEKQFKWDRSQAKAAIDPLIKRHSTSLTATAEPIKKKRSTKRSV